MQSWHGLITLAGLLFVGLANAASEAGQPVSTNRLAGSQAPYLLLHAGNPVDWYPWSEEAFERARRENRPIFLSVGYSTCFWCHVAERTLYSDPDIAELMNRWFINVKVDREQHPDVDRVYMLARRVIAGGGGWPNNVFLTPDLKPFYAGSYFPPQRDEHGRAGFPDVLAAVNRAWTTTRDDVVQRAEQVHTTMQRMTSGGDGREVSRVAPRAWTDAAIRALLRRFDPFQGGFPSPGASSRFPQAPVLQLLLHEYRRSRDPSVAEALTLTLDAIAYGGIHDHLAGGFHRYSTDPDWSVPHFEKMLYDNAQLLGVYAEAHAEFDRPLYRYAALRTADYLLQRMRSPHGAFYTAEDAQVDGVEGASYVWSEAQIVAATDAARAQRLLRLYSLEPVPHSAAARRAAAAPIQEDGAVLRIRQPVSDVLESFGDADLVAVITALAHDRDRLLQHRDRRKAPLRDEKIDVALNGMAIAGLVRAGRALGRPDYVQAAQRAAGHVWRLAFDGQRGTLAHQIFEGTASGRGYLQDHAHLARGLLALHEATGNAKWRDRARRLMDTVVTAFQDDRGRFTSALEARGLPLLIPDRGDVESASGTSAAMAALLTLARGTAPGQPTSTYARAAVRALRHYASTLSRRPEAWPSMLVALDNAQAESMVLAANTPVPGSAPADTPATTLSTPAVLSVRAERDEPRDRIHIHLQVREGFHVNANPASLEELIATQATFRGVQPLRTDYPTPVQFQPEFINTALDVYEGEVSIVAHFDAAALRDAPDLSVSLTAQACNDRVCLPPAVIPVPITPAPSR
jgi:uncharacterized protein YyaL (SSP411 family)